jgi:hypothetical protein
MSNANIALHITYRFYGKLQNVFEPSPPKLIIGEIISYDESEPANDY